ncbi:hypothetical protein GCM10010149_22400 [Nonomuraea roseoviolacea subsp. roseoviolacea]|uniref:hypothetical protein n=1 Tax=Nonomuraea roseoviolacea TaxID=103837 RepID=UPI0031E1E7A2
MGALTARGRDPLARLLRGHRWAAGPTLMSTLASGTAAATTLVIARGTGAAVFGRYSLVMSLALVVSVGMLMSLHYVLLQELPRAAPAARPALVTTALFATLALGAGLAAAAAPLTPLLTAVSGADAGSVWFALALALALTLNQLTESFLRGLARYAFVAALKLAVAGLHLAVTVFSLLVLGVHDASFYLTALIVAYVALALVAVTALPVVPRSWSPALARSLYRHGAYVTVIAALTGVLFGVDVVFLNHWADAADVGVYSVYSGFPRRLLGVVFVEGIGLALFPALATMDKPALLRRVARIAPVAGGVTAVLLFGASAVFFLLMRGQYPYSPALMALSALGIGGHAVFHLYYAALSMDGVRGAKVLIACLAAGAPPALAGQVACVARWGLTGALVSFALTNLLLVAVVAVTAGRVYRRAEIPVPEARR